MSHFAVLVIDTSEEGRDLTEVMQPFHEFECTGVDDRYVVDVDVTDERRADYEADEREFVVDPLGERYDVYDPQFWNPATNEELKFIDGSGRGSGDLPDGRRYVNDLWGTSKYHVRVQSIPQGWRVETFRTRDEMSFEEYLTTVAKIEELRGRKRTDAHKYGYWRRDAEGRTVVIRRTNPNAKWDWWVVGGRYSGKLRVIDPRLADVGENGAFDQRPSAGTYDSTIRSNLDFEAMRLANVARRREAILGAIEHARKSNTGLTEAEIMAVWHDYAAIPQADLDHTLDALRERHPEDWRDRLANVPGPMGVAFGLNLPTAFNFIYGLPRTTDLYAWAEAAPAITAFAVLKDGEWVENGTMGWWGISHGETMSAEAWESTVSMMVMDLPPHASITVVDCHI